MTLPWGTSFDPTIQAPLSGPGLLSPVPPAPMPYVRKPSIIDRIAARLFPTAHYAGLLSPEDQQGISRQALGQFGANLLVAGGASPMQRGTLANIGAALGGVDVNELAQHALQLQAYRSQQQEQQAISAVASHHPVTPGMSRDAIYNNQLQMLNELMTIPGGAAIAEKWAPVIAATKPDKLTAQREPIRIPDVRDNVIGSPTHGMIGTMLLDAESPNHQRIGFIPQVQSSEQPPKPTPQQQQHAEFGAAALAAWKPLDQIRRQNPGVEEEVGRILTSPKFAEAVPGFRTSGDAVSAIARGGGSQAAQNYMRTAWPFLDNVLRTRYATGRLGGPMLQQMAQEFLPGLDVQGNAQIKQNQIQAILSAQGESGFDLNPQMWNNAVKRHGVANMDLQDILAGGTGDKKLKAIQGRY